MSAQYVVPEEWVEAGAVALCWVGFHQPLPGKTPKSYWRNVAPAAKEQYRKEVRAALAAVLPLVVAQERERCIAIAQAEHGDAAQDIDMATRGCDETGRLQSEGAAHAAARIAAAIRQEPGHE